MLLPNTEKSMHRIRRCTWKRSEACLGHQADVPGALRVPFRCVVTVLQHAEMPDWLLKAYLDVLFSVPEVAQLSLPIRAWLGMNIPHFSLKSAGSKSHRQAWKAVGLGRGLGLFSREGRAGHFFPTLAESVPFRAKLRGSLLALCLSEYYALTTSSTNASRLL